MSLFEIDKLIRKTEYEEALHQLNIYIENYPEYFDNAQARIEKIMNARIKYSELATDLIDIIRNDPTNNKKIYEITSQLEKFEKHPSDENLQFIADLKKSAEFNYFRSTFIEIQNGVAECVKKSDVIGAIQKAQEGFWVYKEAFYEQWEEQPDIVQRVEVIVADLNVHLNAFKEKNFLTTIKIAVDDFVKAVNNDQYNLALEKLEPVKVQLDKYYKAVKLVSSDREKLEAVVKELEPYDPVVSQASYLSFLIHYITGVEKIKSSGILPGMNVVWNDYISKMNDSVFSMLTKKYQLYENGIDKVFLSSLEDYVSLERKVFALGNIPYDDKTFVISNPFSDYLMLADYVAVLGRTVLNGVELQKIVKENEKNQSEIIGKIGNSSDVAVRFEEVQKLVEYSAVMDNSLEKKNEMMLELEHLSEDYKKSSYKNWDGLISVYVSIIEDIYNTRDKVIDNSWREVTRFYMMEGEKVYKTLLSYVEVAKAYSDGFFTKIPKDILLQIEDDITKSVVYKDSFNKNKELDFGVYYHYPDITMKLIKYVNDNIENGVDVVSGYKKSLYSNFKAVPGWNSEIMVSDKVAEAGNFIDIQIENIRNLKKEGSPYYDKANDMVIAAEVSKNEGDLRFADAEEALEKQNFAKARKNLQSALVKYDESLNNQNNEDNRLKWDEKLQKLGDEIARRENQLVVLDVRNLKNKAKDAYFNGRFDDAEMYLNQASSKWALTNVTEDPEIENLRNFVNTAISMKTGREILPSAPQYPEMSQLINIAHQNFDEGKYLLETGDKAGSRKKFKQALESIQKVQYVYPLNQEAALLTLQINKLSDPEKFEAEFESKVKTATALCKNKDTQQEGYANLLDYYKLDPDYPGLKKLIYDIEIEIGIRQKPVDNSGKRKGEKYIREAESIFRTAGSNLVELNKALEKVNQALTLIPDNDDAMNLKDKITTKMGGNASTVLSTEDERLYQLAIQKLQNNNVVGANAIVDELLKKPQNKFSKKIKDLKNKIEARS